MGFQCKRESKPHRLGGAWGSNAKENQNPTALAAHGVPMQKRIKTPPPWRRMGFQCKTIKTPPPRRRMGFQCKRESKPHRLGGAWGSNAKQSKPHRLGGAWGSNAKENQNPTALAAHGVPMQKRIKTPPPQRRIGFQCKRESKPHRLSGAWGSNAKENQNPT